MKAKTVAGVVAALFAAILVFACGIYLGASVARSECDVKVYEATIAEHVWTVGMVRSFKALDPGVYHVHAVVKGVGNSQRAAIVYAVVPMSDIPLFVDRIPSELLFEGKTFSIPLRKTM